MHFIIMIMSCLLPSFVHSLIEQLLSNYYILGVLASCKDAKLRKNSPFL